MKHTHKLKRILIGSKDYYVYKCVECPSFTQVKASTGRETRCWGCDQSIKITEVMISEGIVKPFCDSCKELRRERKLLMSSIPEESEVFEEEFEE